MRRSDIREIPFSLPSPFLEKANWVDSFQKATSLDLNSAQDAVDVMFAGEPPLWVRALNNARNLIVAPIGLRTGVISVDSEKVGAFPITHQSDQSVVFGFDDWHLNFRVLVEVASQERGSVVRLSTLVARRHWFGYAYLFTITPFHKLIVRSLLSKLPG